MYSVCTVQLYNVYKQTSAGRRVRPTPGGTVQNSAKCTTPPFVLLRALLRRGCIFIFSSTPQARISYSTSISHSTAPHRSLSHFPKSQTNLIPKPFFAHNSLPIHHHFPPLTPHSHLFPAHSISFQPHSFYH